MDKKILLKLKKIIPAWAEIKMLDFQNLGTQEYFDKINAILLFYNEMHLNSIKDITLPLNGKYIRVIPDKYHPYYLRIKSFTMCSDIKIIGFGDPRYIIIADKIYKDINDNLQLSINTIINMSDLLNSKNIFIYNKCKFFDKSFKRLIGEEYIKSIV